MGRKGEKSGFKPGSQPKPYVSFWQRAKSCLWFKAVALVVVVSFLYQDVVWAVGTEFVPSLFIQKAPSPSLVDKLARLVLSSDALAWETTYSQDYSDSGSSYDYNYNSYDYNSYTPSSYYSYSYNTNPSYSTPYSSYNSYNSFSYSGIQVPGNFYSIKDLNLTNDTGFFPIGTVTVNGGEVSGALVTGMATNAGTSGLSFSLPAPVFLVPSSTPGSYETAYSSTGDLSRKGNYLSLAGVPVTFWAQGQADRVYSWQDSLQGRSAHVAFNKDIGNLNFNAYLTSKSSIIPGVSPEGNVSIDWNIASYNRTVQSPSTASMFTNPQVENCSPSPSSALVTSGAVPENLRFTLTDSTHQLYFTNAGLTAQVGDTWTIGEQVTGLFHRALTFTPQSSYSRVVLMPQRVIVPRNLTVSNSDYNKEFNYYGYDSRWGKFSTEIVLLLKKGPWEISFDSRGLPTNLGSAVIPNSGRYSQRFGDEIVEGKITGIGSTLFSDGRKLPTFRIEGKQILFPGVSITNLTKKPEEQPRINSSFVSPQLTRIKTLIGEITIPLSPGKEKSLSIEIEAVQAKGTNGFILRPLFKEGKLTGGGIDSTSLAFSPLAYWEGVGGAELKRDGSDRRIIKNYDNWIPSSVTIFLNKPEEIAEIKRNYLGINPDQGEGQLNFLFSLSQHPRLSLSQKEIGGGAEIRTPIPYSLSCMERRKEGGWKWKYPSYFVYFGEEIGKKYSLKQSILGSGETIESSALPWRQRPTSKGGVVVDYKNFYSLPPSLTSSGYRTHPDRNPDDIKQVKQGNPKLIIKEVLENKVMHMEWAPLVIGRDEQGNPTASILLHDCTFINNSGSDIYWAKNQKNGEYLVWVKPGNYDGLTDNLILISGPPDKRNATPLYNLNATKALYIDSKGNILNSGNKLKLKGDGYTGPLFRANPSYLNTTNTRNVKAKTLDVKLKPVEVDKEEQQIPFFKQKKEIELVSSTSCRITGKSPLYFGVSADTTGQYNWHAFLKPDVSYKVKRSNKIRDLTREEEKIYSQQGQLGVIDGKLTMFFNKVGRENPYIYIEPDGEGRGFFPSEPPSSLPPAELEAKNREYSNVLEITVKEGWLSVGLNLDANLRITGENPYLLAKGVELALVNNPAVPALFKGNWYITLTQSKTIIFKDGELERVENATLADPVYRRPYKLDKGIEDLQELLFGRESRLLVKFEGNIPRDFSVASLNSDVFNSWYWGEKLEHLGIMFNIKGKDYIFSRGKIYSGDVLGQAGGGFYKKREKILKELEELCRQNQSNSELYQLIKYIKEARPVSIPRINTVLRELEKNPQYKKLGIDDKLKRRRDELVELFTNHYYPLAELLRWGLKGLDNKDKARILTLVVDSSVLKEMAQSLGISLSAKPSELLQEISKEINSNELPQLKELIGLGKEYEVKEKYLSQIRDAALIISFNRGGTCADRSYLAALFFQGKDLGKKDFLLGAALFNKHTALAVSKGVFEEPQGLPRIFLDYAQNSLWDIFKPSSYYKAKGMGEPQLLLEGKLVSSFLYEERDFAGIPAYEPVINNFSLAYAHYLQKVIKDKVGDISQAYKNFSACLFATPHLGRDKELLASSLFKNAENPANITFSMLTQGGRVSFSFIFGEKNFKFTPSFYGPRVSLISYLVNQERFNIYDAFYGSFTLQLTRKKIKEALIRVNLPPDLLARLNPKEKQQIEQFLPSEFPKFSPIIKKIDEKLRGFQLIRINGGFNKENNQWKVDTFLNNEKNPILSQSITPLKGFIPLESTLISFTMPFFELIFGEKKKDKDKSSLSPEPSKLKGEIAFVVSPIDEKLLKAHPYLPLLIQNYTLKEGEIPLGPAWFFITTARVNLEKDSSLTFNFKKGTHYFTPVAGLVKWGEPTPYKIVGKENGLEYFINSGGEAERALPYVTTQKIQNVKENSLRIIGFPPGKITFWVDNNKRIVGVEETNFPVTSSLFIKNKGGWIKLQYLNEESTPNLLVYGGNTADLTVRYTLPSSSPTPGGNPTPPSVRDIEDKAKIVVVEKECGREGKTHHLTGEFPKIALTNSGFLPIFRVPTKITIPGRPTEKIYNTTQQGGLQINGKAVDNKVQINNSTYLGAGTFLVNNFSLGALTPQSIYYIANRRKEDNKIYNLMQIQAQRGAGKYNLAVRQWAYDNNGKAEIKRDESLSTHICFGYEGRNINNPLYLTIEEINGRKVLTVGGWGEYPFVKGSRIATNFEKELTAQIQNLVFKKGGGTLSTAAFGIKGDIAYLIGKGKGGGEKVEYENVGKPTIETAETKGEKVNILTRMSDVLMRINFNPFQENLPASPFSLHYTQGLKINKLEGDYFNLEGRIVISPKHTIEITEKGEFKEGYPIFLPENIDINKAVNQVLEIVKSGEIKDNKIWASPSKRWWEKVVRWLGGRSKPPSCIEAGSSEEKYLFFKGFTLIKGKAVPLFGYHIRVGSDEYYVKEGSKYININDKFELFDSKRWSLPYVDLYTGEVKEAHDTVGVKILNRLHRQVAAVFSKEWYAWARGTTYIYPDTWQNHILPYQTTQELINLVSDAVTVIFILSGIGAPEAPAAREAIKQGLLKLLKAGAVKSFFPALNFATVYASTKSFKEAAIAAGISYTVGGLLGIRRLSGIGKIMRIKKGVSGVVPRIVPKSVNTVVSKGKNFVSPRTIFWTQTNLYTAQVSSLATTGHIMGGFDTLKVIGTSYGLQAIPQLGRLAKLGINKVPLNKVTSKFPTLSNKVNKVGGFLNKPLIKHSSPFVIGAGIGAVYSKYNGGSILGGLVIGATAVALFKSPSFIRWMSGKKFMRRIFGKKLNSSSSLSGKFTNVIKTTNNIESKYSLSSFDNLLKNYFTGPQALLASTYGAYLEYKGIKELKNKGIDNPYPFLKFGPFGYLLSLPLNPGRFMFSLIKKDKDILNNLYTLRSVFLSYARENKFSGTILSFLSSYFDMAICASTSALQIYGTVNIKDTLKDFALMLKPLFGEKTEENIPSASWAEWAALLGGVLGATKGFRVHSQWLREITKAPSRISRGKYSSLPLTSRVGYFLAKTDETARTLMWANTGLSLVVSSVSEGGFQRILSSAYQIAHSGLYTLGASSYSLALFFESLGALGREFDKIKGIKNTSLARFLRGEYWKTNINNTQIRWGRGINVTIPTIAGLGLQHWGYKNKGSLSTLAILSGQILFALGLKQFSYNIKNLSIFRRSKFFTQKRYFESFAPFTSDRAWKHTLKYDAIAGISGSSLGLLAEKFLLDSKGADKKYLTGALGAIGGILFRRKPHFYLYPVELYSSGLLYYSLYKTGIPFINWLDYKIRGTEVYSNKEFGEIWAKEARPYGVDLLAPLLGGKLIHTRTIKEYTKSLAQLNEDQLKNICEKYNLNEEEVKRVLWEYRHLTGERKEQALRKLREFHKNIKFDKEGYLLNASGERILFGTRRVSDLVKIFMFGLMGRALLEGVKVAKESYYKGLPSLEKGFKVGFKEAYEKFVSRPTGFLGKGHSINDWYKLGVASPSSVFLSSGEIPFWIASYYGLKGLGKWSEGKEAKRDFIKAGMFAGAGVVLGLIGLGVLKSVPDEINVSEILSGAKGWARVGRKACGGFNALSKLTTSLAKDTIRNLFLVMAPLAVGVDAVSYFSKEYLSYTAENSIERFLYNDILGAFWLTKYEAALDGEEPSIKKIQYILNASKDNTLWGKTLKLLKIAGQYYLIGLSGVWTKEELSKLDKEELIKIARLKGISPTEREELIKELAGTARVGLSLKEIGVSLNRSFFGVDKTLVWFSLALAFLHPTAEALFSNIKKGSFGRKFKALGEGWDAFVERLGPQPFYKLARKEAKLPFSKRLYELMVGGTSEEVVAENVIQIGLNIIPFRAFLPQNIAMQTQEILQEILTPKGNLPHLSYNQFYAFLREGGVIKAINLRTQVNEKTQEIIDGLVGNSWQDLTEKDLYNLQNIVQAGAYGDLDVEIIIEDKDGYHRTVEIKDIEGWNRFFETYKYVKRYEGKSINELLRVCADIKKDASTEPEREAAKILLAQKIVNEANLNNENLASLGLFLAGAGDLEISFINNDNLNLKRSLSDIKEYIATELSFKGLTGKVREATIEKIKKYAPHLILLQE